MLMPLIKQIGPAVEKRRLDQLQPLTDQIGNAIREASLDDAFRNWHPTTPIIPPTSTTLPTTEKNRFLIEGDLADVVALYNAGPKARHVALNLRGEFVFADDRANVCLFGRNPDGVALTVRGALAPYNLKAVTGLDQPCDPQRLDAYDVVAMQRGTFLKKHPVDALSLIKQIEIGAMRKFALVSAADQAAASAAERAAIEQISTDVAAGAKTGFGVIFLLKTGYAQYLRRGGRQGRSAQAAHPQERRQADVRHATCARDRRRVGRGRLRRRAKSPVRRDMYASAADLKTIGNGLAHAAIPFSFSSLWIASPNSKRDAEVAEEAPPRGAAGGEGGARRRRRGSAGRSARQGSRRDWAAQQATLAHRSTTARPRPRWRRSSPTSLTGHKTNAGRPGSNTRPTPRGSLK